jgi:hypothetical protein
LPSDSIRAEVAPQTVRKHAFSANKLIKSIAYMKKGRTLMAPAHTPA